MNAFAGQGGLFDKDVGCDPAQAAGARRRMRDMIERLAGTDVPPWKDQMGVILDDGAFQRAMRLVPDAEAQTLWQEFDSHMERLHAIWQCREPNPL